MAYFFILVINIFFLYFLKTGHKYWLLSIPLWVLLITGFIFWRVQSDRHIQTLEIAYWKSAETRGFGDVDKRDILEYTQKQARELNMTFLICITLQTLITFICQIAGQSETELKLYKWTKIIFAILFSLIFILMAMMGFVPTGGMIG